MQRIDLATGRVLRQDRRGRAGLGDHGRRRLRLGDRAPRLGVHRIDPGTNRSRRRSRSVARVPYAWAGGGAVWAADDEGQAMIRIDPASGAQVARVPVGNGPAGFAFDGSFVWILNHRENTLDRIDPATNQVVRMATILGGERRRRPSGSPSSTGCSGSPAADSTSCASRRRRAPWSARPRSAPAASTSSPTGASLWVVSYRARRRCASASRSWSRCSAHRRGRRNRSDHVPDAGALRDGVAAANGQLWSSTPWRGSSCGFRPEAPAVE